MYKLCTEIPYHLFNRTYHLFNELLIRYLLIYYKLTSSTVHHRAKYMPHI